jgi:uncharacterized protein with gpF-like domain
MTARQARLLAERQAARYRPEMQRTILAAWRDLARAIPVGQVERLIAAGAFDELARIIEGAFPADRLRDVSRETFRAGYVGARVPLPNVRFDLLNPVVSVAIRTMENAALASLRSEVRDVVRAAVTRGLAEGKGPRAVARGIRDVIGLGPTQLTEVENFRLALVRMGESADAFNYKARDKRFDATLKRIRKEGGELSAEQIDGMVDAYRTRRIALNAEAHARTTALNAQRAGNNASWAAAIEDAGLSPSQVLKTWVTTMDGRERDEHGAANGIEVPFDQPFPVDGGVMVPGEGVWNCRCVSVYRVTRAA